MKNREVYLSFWGHIEQLRGTFIRIFAIILIGIALAFFFYERIINIAIKPLENLKNISCKQATIKEESFNRIRIYNSGPGPVTYQFDEEEVYIDQLSSGAQQISQNTIFLPEGEHLFINKKIDQNLFVLGPVEGMFIALKLSLCLGIVGTAPFWTLSILKFIMPALRNKEKNLVVPFVTMSFVFILLGLLLAYFVTIPLTNSYLQTFNQKIAINMWSLERYLDYTLFLMLANAVAFEIGALGVFLVYTGILKANWLREQRRLMIVFAFILGAILTPPDIFTQCFLALLLICLYELLIFYAKFRQFSSRKTFKALTVHE